MSWVRTIGLVPVAAAIELAVRAPSSAAYNAMDPMRPRTTTLRARLLPSIQWHLHESFRMLPRNPCKPSIMGLLVGLPVRDITDRTAAARSYYGKHSRSARW
ncbi:hypothetical protein PsYK624_060630 [Phanerochaete sordida]|uniref:Secreted protein n=1 Tax=Phanerochaete sordida TaxID=48140 RepID=A0A9P3LCU9_9APHY|nr:hypothetical protein PsYK624_060630 [Phanerochaete sordida]